MAYFQVQAVSFREGSQVSKTRTNPLWTLSLPRSGSFQASCNTMGFPRKSLSFFLGDKTDTLPKFNIAPEKLPSQ